LALLQTTLFLLMFALAGTAAVLLIRQAEGRAINAEIRSETGKLTAVYAHSGLPALKALIDAHDREPSPWEYRAEDQGGRYLAGDLPASPRFPLGWASLRLVEGDRPDSAPEKIRGLTRILPDGVRLTVGVDLGEKHRDDDEVMASVLAVAALVAATGLGIGAAVGARVLRRIDAMSLAMSRYANGDVAARVEAPVKARTDLDQLALALNSMMDRAGRLMQSLRQVSSDIAHDLRRPLAHHNQEIARVLAGPPSVEIYGEALAAAADRVDEVLRTFQALLQIAELEAGAPGLEMEQVDLTALAARVVDAYAPGAEAGGRRLTLITGTKDAAPSSVRGEARLLGRMLANLVENALVHTPVGTNVIVTVSANGQSLSVADDGPGVPLESRSRIFERFVRLDASRTTPGTGLGLALAAAVATAFHGQLRAEDAQPGLRIIADFTAADRL